MVFAIRDRDVSELAKVVGVGPIYFARILRLNHRAPDIQTSIVDGTQLRTDRETAGLLQPPAGPGAAAAIVGVWVSGEVAPTLPSALGVIGSHSGLELPRASLRPS